MRFENKSVIITGGGGKIAKAYAMAFAKEGAKVSLPDVASADAVVKAIKDMGGTAISMACDVSNEKSVKAMVDETVKQFGTIDVLINNAAYFMTVWKGPFWEMTVEEFDKAMTVNVRGSWLCRPVHAEAEEWKDYQHFVERRPDRQSELHSLRHFQRGVDRDDSRHGP
jgi:NAD(P)-dependent dehydrogenase (short-subunit alcohol dehydrogenase family)